MCVDMCVDMWVEMCEAICVDMCVDKVFAEHKITSTGQITEAVWKQALSLAGRH